jgi:hypothetical protein
LLAVATRSSRVESSTSYDEDARRINLRRRLVVAPITPTAVLTVAGAILAVQLQRVTNGARWLDATDEVLACSLARRTRVARRLLPR